MFLLPVLSCRSSAARSTASFVKLSETEAEIESSDSGRALAGSRDSFDRQTRDLLVNALMGDPSFQNDVPDPGYYF